MLAIPLIGGVPKGLGRPVIPRGDCAVVPLAEKGVLDVETADVGLPNMGTGGIWTLKSGDLFFAGVTSSVAGTGIFGSFNSFDSFGGLDGGDASTMTISFDSLGPEGVPLDSTTLLVSRFNDGDRNCWFGSGEGEPASVTFSGRLVANESCPFRFSLPSNRRQ